MTILLLLCGLMGVGIAGLAHSLISLTRNHEVFRFENWVDDKIHEHNLALLASGTSHGMLEFPAIRHEEMVRKFWVPLTIERWYPELAPHFTSLLVVDSILSRIEKESAGESNG